MSPFGNVFMRGWIVLVILLIIVGGYQLITYQAKPQNFNLPAEAMEEGRRRLVDEGNACTELKTVKQCTYGGIQVTFASCGPRDGTDRIYDDETYFSEFNLNAPVTPVFHTVIQGAGYGNSFKHYRGPLDICPPYPIMGKSGK